MTDYWDCDAEDGFQVQFDFDDPVTWESQTMEATMQWVRRMISFHRDRLTWVKPPDYPFVLRLDPMGTLLTLTCANIFTVDIDDIEKPDAEKKIASFAKRHGMTFRLYETDHGMHGYCTSEAIHWTDPRVQELMEDLEGCDKLYTAFVKQRGFSWRLSPKLYSKLSRERRVPVPRQDFVQAFVKRPWKPNPKVGRAPELPELKKVVDLARELTEFVCAMPQLYERMNDALRLDAVIRSVAQEAARLFDKNRSSLKKWLRLPGTYDVPYINDIREERTWFPSRPPKDRNLNARHPVDGRLITVYRIRRGRWSWCHRKGFLEFTRGEKYESKSEAKRAAVRHFHQCLRDAEGDYLEDTSDDKCCDVVTPEKSSRQAKKRKHDGDEVEQAVTRDKKSPVKRRKSA
eukprot:TRINITY_DN75173_c0_g1_i1.p1 TRINITY_DN75173_c0_g1~~TRINITY_DN75173_c0_g1_i1.p1  ORF type:complete len:402 (+),score=62.61 TRINITY_DN75173_c0_g1_i1:138-1343(+)